MASILTHANALLAVYCFRTTAKSQDDHRKAETSDERRVRWQATTDATVPSTSQGGHEPIHTAISWLGPLFHAQPAAAYGCQSLDCCLQLLNKKQVSKLQKAAKLASVLAKDGPLHKHPAVLSGAFQFHILALLHSSVFTCYTRSKDGCSTNPATGELQAEDILSHTGLSGHESAPVLAVPGQIPCMPTHIHTENGPPTAHMLHEDDHRMKKRPSGAPAPATRPNDVV